MREERGSLNASDLLIKSNKIENEMETYKSYELFQQVKLMLIQ